MSAPRARAERPTGRCGSGLARMREAIAILKESPAPEAPVDIFKG